MKKITFLVFLFMTIVGYSQINRYSKPVKPARFQPLSYDELAIAAMANQQRYDANQKYLYDMKKWILELKPQIQEEEFISDLDGLFSILTKMEEYDLAKITKDLKQVEILIRKIVSEYNIWVNKQNNKSQSNSSNNPNNSTNINYAEEGFALQKKKEFADAIFNYTKFLESNEDNTDVLFLRAMCKSELNDRYGAINDYDRIIELEKTAKPTVYKMSTVYNNKAYCLVGLKQYEEALLYVTKALELDKTEAYIWDTRGELYYHIGEYEKSIKDMNEAIKIKENANSYYYRGLANLKLDNKSKACSDFSKAGELGESKAYNEISENCNE